MATDARAPLCNVLLRRAHRNAVRDVAATGLALAVAVAGGVSAADHEWRRAAGNVRTDGLVADCAGDAGTGATVVLLLRHDDASGQRDALVEIGDRAVVRFVGRGADALVPTEADFRGRLAVDETAGRATLDLDAGANCVVANGVVVFEGPARAAAPGEGEMADAEARRFRQLDLAARYARDARWREASALADAALAAPGGPATRTTVYFAFGEILAADLRLDLGKPDRSAAAVDAAAQVLASRLPPGHPAVIKADHVRGRLLKEAGDYRAARELRESIVTRLAEAARPDDEAAISNRIYLASLHYLQGDRTAALGLATDTYARARVALGETRPLTVLAAVSLAHALDAADRPQEALAVIEPLYPQVVAAFGERHPLSAHMLFGLANLRMGAGKLHDARAAAESAYAIFLAEFGADSLHTINAQERTAFVYSELSRYDEAIAMQREVVASFTSTLGPNHMQTLLAAANLAGWYRITGRQAEGWAVVHRVHEEFSRQLGDAHPQTLEAAKAAAFADLDTGRIATGCAVLERMASGPELRQPGLAATRAEALFGAGRCRLATGDPRAALAAFREYEAVLPGAQDETSEDRLLVNAAIALAQLQAGEKKAAIATLTAMVAASEAARRQEAPQAGGGRSYFSDLVAGRAYLAGYRDLALLHARAGNVADAIRVAELARARSITDALALRPEIDPAAGSQRNQALAARLAAQLKDVDAEIALAPAASPRRVELALKRTDLVAALEEVLQRSSGRAAASGAAGGVGAVPRSRDIPRGHAYVGFEYVRGVAWAYVLRRDAAPVVLVLGELPWLGSAIATLRSAVASAEPPLAPIWKSVEGEYVEALTLPAPGAVRVSVSAIGDELARALLVPLRRRLAGVERVVLSVDGVLAGLPFEVLPLDGGPLVQRVEVTYVPSFGAWKMLRDGPAPAFSRDLVAVGAPDYQRLSRAGPGPLDGLAWAPLPGTTVEIQRIAREFPATRVAVLDGDRATRAAFVRANRDGTLKRARFLHIAAHAYLSPAAPQWSALVLGGSDGAPGYVTAAELATYDLASELVVLSACETALGRDVPGEGLFGLPYALIVAGARSALLSLWPVSDASAAAFMGRFYARLARGAAPASALAETKREFIRDPEYAAPFHWAPWVLYGGAAVAATGRPGR